LGVSLLDLMREAILEIRLMRDLREVAPENLGQCPHATDQSAPLPPGSFAELS
jgi:hypothetical protein